jgi:hypothetical protein
MTLRFYSFRLNFSAHPHPPCFGYDTKYSGGSILAVMCDNLHSSWFLNTQKDVKFGEACRIANNLSGKCVPIVRAKVRHSGLVLYVLIVSYKLISKYL